MITKVTLKSKDISFLKFMCSATALVFSLSIEISNRDHLHSFQRNNKCCREGFSCRTAWSEIWTFLQMLEGFLWIQQTSLGQRSDRKSVEGHTKINQERNQVWKGLIIDRHKIEVKQGIGPNKILHFESYFPSWRKPHVVWYFTVKWVPEVKSETCCHW